MARRKPRGDYPEAQYTALLGLLDRLATGIPSIVRREIIGHSDVATDVRGRLGRKSSDPGLSFHWRRLEAENLGLIIRVGPQPPWIYGGFFQIVPGGAFRNRDNDDTRRFGGATRPGVTGDPVEEIQRDLAAIGYSVGTPDGDYGQMTTFAVQMFQEHFFAGGRGPAPNGRVDFQTAARLKSVR